MARFIDINISNCNGAGMSVAHGSLDNAYIEGLTISNCGAGLVERDPISLRERLGLPDDTPYLAILDALTRLTANRNESPEKKAEIVKQSTLGPFLQKAANATALVKNMVDLSASPQAQQIITMIKRAIGL